MAERKHTPDILSEILGGSSEPLPVVPAVPRRTVKKPMQPPTEPVKRIQTKRYNYEYEVVSFQEHKGWRSRFINGKEIPNWTSAPLIHEYIQQKAGEGWELVSATSGEHLYAASDNRQLFFRRIIES